MTQRIVDTRIPHIEKRKGKKYYVVRNTKGYIITARKIDQKSPSLQRIKEIYSQNNTFYDNIKKVRLSKVVETTVTQKSEYKSGFNKKKGYEPESPYGKRPVRGFRHSKKPQYQVSGVVVVNNKPVEIHRRSMKLGSPECMTPQACHDYAWTKFLEEVSQAYGASYDDDKGLFVVDKVQNITEGWVWYDAR